MMNARINIRIPHLHDMKVSELAIQEGCDKFPPADFEKIIKSLPNRIKVCIKNRGGATYY